MQRLVQGCKEALEERDFAEALRLAKKALEEDDGEPKMHVLAGRAALGAGRLAEAEGFFTKALELNPSLMPPLARLVEVYEALGDREQVGSIRKRQMELALQKGNDKKVSELMLKAAQALEHVKSEWRNALGLFKEFWERTDDEGKTFDVCEAILRLEMLLEIPFGNVSVLKRFLLGEQDSNRISRITAFRYFTVAEKSASTVEDVCNTFRNTSEPDSEAYKEATDLLLAIALESDNGFNPAILEIAASSEIQSWQKDAVLAAVFAEANDFAKARKLCDQATLKLREAREAYEERKRKAAAEEKKSKPTGVKIAPVVLGAKPPAQEVSDVFPSEKLLKAYDEILSGESCRFWLLRSELLLRCFTQGSAGRLREMKAAFLAAQEGLKAHEKLKALAFFPRSEEFPSLLNARRLEAASWLMQTEGDKLARKACEDSFDLECIDAVLARNTFLGLKGEWDQMVKKEMSNPPSLVDRHFAALEAYRIMNSPAGLPNQAAEAADLLKVACTPFAPSVTMPVDVNVENPPKVTSVMPWFLALQGELSRKSGDLKNASKYLLKAVQLDKEAPFTFTSLGKMYEAKGERERSFKCFERAATLNPLNFESVKALAHFYWERGQRTLLKDLLRKATAKCEFLAQSGSSTFLHRNLLNFCWMALGRLRKLEQEYKEAMSCFQTAIGFNEENPLAWLGLGETYIEMKRLESAKSALETALNFCDTSSTKTFIAHRLGNLLLELKQSREAEAVFSLGLRLQSKSLIMASGFARSQLLEAKRLASLGCHETALESSRTALRVLSECSETHSSICEVLAETLSFSSTMLPSLGRSMDEVREEAISATRKYAEVIFLEPWREASWRSTAQHQIRLAAQSKRKNEHDLHLARRCSEAALSLSPTNARNWTLLGTSHALLDPFNGLAQHCLVRATQLDPVGSNEAWSNLGVLLHRAGRKKASLRTLVETQGGNSSVQGVTWTLRGVINDDVAPLRCAAQALTGCSPSLAPLSGMVLFCKKLIEVKRGDLNFLEWLEVESLMRQVVRRDEGNAGALFLLDCALKRRMIATNEKDEPMREPTLQESKKRLYLSPWDQAEWSQVGRALLHSMESMFSSSSKDLNVVLGLLDSAEKLKGHELESTMLLRSRVFQHLGNLSAARSIASRLFWIRPFDSNAQAFFLSCSETRAQLEAANRILAPKEKHLVKVFVESKLMKKGSKSSEDRSHHLEKLFRARACSRKSLVPFFDAIKDPALETPLKSFALVEMALTAGEHFEESADFAQKCFDLAIEEESADYPVWAFFRLAQAHFLAIRFGVHRCLGVMNKAAKLFPERADVHLVRGWLGLLVGDSKNKKSATSSFKKALELEPEFNLARELLEEQ